MPLETFPDSYLALVHMYDMWHMYHTPEAIRGQTGHTCNTQGGSR